MGHGAALAPMAGELNLSALRTAGAAITAAPVPAVPALEWAETLRARFDRGYAHELDVRDGLASRYSDTSGRCVHVAGASRRLNARDAATEPRCGDCGAIRSPSITTPCASCGSSQPPRLGNMNPRAMHMIGEAPLR
jgi:hypothetical protein